MTISAQTSFSDLSRDHSLTNAKACEQEHKYLEKMQCLEEENRTLRIRNQELEKASHAKDLFLTMLSHELRIPLTVVISWAQILKMGKIDPKNTQTAIQIIEEHAFIQNQIINDLLDVSSIALGKITIQPQQLNLAELLEKLIASIAPNAENKKIKLTLELDTPAEVFADPIRLQQIFGNLLSNALKFTPAQGEIQIKLKIFNETIQVSVQDTGIGITADFLPRLFDCFSQAQLNRSKGSLGMGLTIVHNLLKLQGGSIKAESGGEGKGATFTVILPKNTSLMT